MSVSQKFVPLISCAIILIKTFIISTWSFKEMFIALSSTCVQNVSYRYASFDCLFITFFKDVTAWSEISHVAWRAPDDSQRSLCFVFTWYAVATSIPNNIFFQVRQLEKNILGIHSKKNPFRPEAFVLLHMQIRHKLSVAWRTEQNLFLPSQGPSTIVFHEPGSGLSLLTVVRATSSCFLFCS